jgi:addiction module HigA family antidote
MKRTAKRDLDRCPTHPGELLRDDILHAIGIGKSEVAQVLGISRQHLYDILNEKKTVSPETVARLYKAFGDGAGVWLRVQAAYDAWRAERSVDVSKVVTIRAG